MLLNDEEITARCLSESPMITPFYAESINQDEEGRKLLSYGTSSFGYDITLGPEFHIFTNIANCVVDPKRFDRNTFIDVDKSDGSSITLPPHSFTLCRSFEWFKIPRDILVICLGKSTYARCGLIVNVTPLEPEWEGHITLELSNTNPNPVVVYPFEGIAQLLFAKGNPCRVSYRDRGGKYQGQRGITLPRMHRTTPD